MIFLSQKFLSLLKEFAKLRDYHLSSGQLSKSILTLIVTKQPHSVHLPPFLSKNWHLLQISSLFLASSSGETICLLWDIAFAALEAELDKLLDTFKLSLNKFLKCSETILKFICCWIHIRISKVYRFIIRISTLVSAINCVTIFLSYWQLESSC